MVTTGPRRDHSRSSPLVLGQFHQDQKSDDIHGLIRPETAEEGRLFYKLAPVNGGGELPKEFLYGRRTPSQGEDGSELPEAGTKPYHIKVSALPKTETWFLSPPSKRIKQGRPGARKDSTEKREFPRRSLDKPDGFEFARMGKAGEDRRKRAHVEAQSPIATDSHTGLAVGEFEYIAAGILGHGMVFDLDLKPCIQRGIAALLESRLHVNEPQHPLFTGRLDTGAIGGDQFVKRALRGVRENH
jgi:hypothetical protein